MNPISAVTSPDPYGYYAELAAERPFYFDQELAIWVATGAEVVAEVLSNPQCRVRPTAEPIPKALVGSPSGRIFGLLMRMNEGSAHDPLKDAIVGAVNSEREGQCRRLASKVARSIVEEGTPLGLSHVVRRLMFQLPTSVMGELLGVEACDRSELATQVSAFVTGLPADASAEQRAAGDCAAEALLARFGHTVENRENEGPLLGAFHARCSQAGLAKELVSANAIGLLFQTYDATAGLIGNSFRNLKRNPFMVEILRQEPDQIERFAGETSRTDPSIHNTRRYVSESTVIAGNSLPAGSQILVVLAAANYGRGGEDPCFAFGSGTHRCPGQALTRQVVAAAVEAVIVGQEPLETLVESGRFKASVNVRVPVF
jgi:cytochrome P450